MTSTFHTGPAPSPAPERDRRGPMRRRFDEMKAQQWERFIEPTELEVKRIRVTARDAGCECYWEDGTRNLIVRRKGKAK